jgi:exopolysaccharide biosynthesis polyprenyl glycosylphosphotransferase
MPREMIVSHFAPSELRREQNSAYQLTRYEKIRRMTDFFISGFLFLLYFLYMRRADLAFAALLVPLDYLALLAAASFAYSLRFAPWLTTYIPVQFALTYREYILTAMGVGLIYLLTFAFSGLYAVRPKGGILSEALRVGISSSAAMAVVLAIAFFSRELFDSRFIMLAAWGFAILFVSTARIGVRYIQKAVRLFGIDVTSLVVIGKTKTSQNLLHTLAAHPSWGYRVALNLPHFSSDIEKKLRTLRREGRIDGILLANPNASREEILAAKTFSDNEHLTFLYSADIFAGSTLRPITHSFGDSPVIEVPKTPLDGWGAIYKRMFDIVGSLLLIILTLPLQLLIALLIVIDSPGGIFFSRLPGGGKAMRVGQYGKLFHYFKFRSMYRDRHFERYNELAAHNTRSGPLVKINNDPRITRIGRFIRKTSLDELPEFWLVLMGRMSLVGPRPHLPEEVDKYRPEHRRVLTIKPGITGLPQISGRAALDFDDEVRLDMHYIENWTPWLDITILLKTPFVVLLRKGAS